MEKGNEGEGEKKRGGEGGEAVDVRVFVVFLYRPLYCRDGKKGGGERRENTKRKEEGGKRKGGEEE